MISALQISGAAILERRGLFAMVTGLAVSLDAHADGMESEDRVIVYCAPYDSSSGILLDLGNPMIVRWVRIDSESKAVSSCEGWLYYRNAIALVRADGFASERSTADVVSNQYVAHSLKALGF